MEDSADTGTERVFDVSFTCQATNDAGMRTDMMARMIAPDTMEFALASDEGAFHVGGGTAPTPLMLFAGGLTSCLMTQLRAFSKRLRIDAGRLSCARGCNGRGGKPGASLMSLARWDLRLISKWTAARRKKIAAA